MHTQPNISTRDFRATVFVQNDDGTLSAADILAARDLAYLSHMVRDMISADCYRGIFHHVLFEREGHYTAPFSRSRNPFGLFD